MLEFLVTEGPDPKTTDKDRFCQEFANLVLLFIELQRAGVFSHDFYVKELIRTGEMLEYIPLMQKIRERKEEKQKVDPFLCFEIFFNYFQFASFCNF